MKRTIMTALTLCLAAILPFLFASCRRIPNGGLEGGLKTVKPGAKVKSQDLTGFVMCFQWGGRYAEDNERSVTCPSGWYELSMKAGEDGADCALLYRPIKEEDEIRAEFTVDVSALEDLQAVIESSGIADLNGFSARNSARGYYCAIDADYASGEHLKLHGEGGASAEVPADVCAVVDFFSRLAVENGERFNQ